MNFYLIHIFDIRRYNILFTKVSHDRSQHRFQMFRFILLLSSLLFQSNFFLNNSFSRKNNKS